jgi:hypothetical protein
MVLESKVIVLKSKSCGVVDRPNSCTASLTNSTKLGRVRE